MPASEKEKGSGPYIPLAQDHKIPASACGRSSFEEFDYWI